MSSRLLLAVLFVGLACQCLASSPFTVHHKFFCKPHAVANAYYGKRLYITGSTIVYRCRSHFKIHGHAEQQCLYGGKWNHPAPVCKPAARQCRRPKGIANGIIKPVEDDRVLYNAGEKIWFKCNRGFTLKGKADLTCLDTGRWNAAFPVCVANARQCRRPKGIANGIIKPVDDDRVLYNAGEKIWFKCNRGFTLKGKADLTCLDTGRWNAAFPVCVADARQCRRPKGIANGIIRPVDDDRVLYNAGEKIWFKCNRGFTLKGKADLTCLDTGRWNAAFPVCVADARQCRRPKGIANGIIRPVDDDRVLYNAGEKIWFKCNRGFTLKGKADLTCLDTGKWNAAFPVCVADARQCRRPKGIANGIIRPVDDDRVLYNAGEKIWFKCNRGFTLKGKADLTCLVTGKWNADFPVCVADARQCRRPKGIANGIIKPVDDDRVLYNAGEKIWFKCNRGFTLKGKADLTCLDTGRWNAAFPVCVADARQCRRPKGIANGIIRPVDDDRVLYNAGEKIWFKCNRGFTLKGRADLTCLVTGKWNADFPVCVADARQCRRPKGIANGIIKPVDDDRVLYNAGEKIWFKCNRGFTLKGKADLTCLDTGRWNAAFPVCVADARQCRRPKGIANGVIRPVDDDRVLYNAGEKIWFKCNRGFTLKGRADLTCLVTGKWNADFPVCVADARQCRRPKGIANGIIKPVDDDRVLYNAGEKIWFKCNRGFTLKGKADLTCLDTGRWNAAFPVCVADARQCRRPKGIANGIIKPVDDDRVLYNAGEKIWFKCNRGFTLKGKADLTCLDTGRWNAAFPVCVGASHTTVTACELSKPVYVRCPRGQKIQVVSGFYGRDNAKTCPSRHNRTDKCHPAKGSFEKLQKFCHNRYSCRLWASNKIFGDNCPGTRKYIQLTYFCQGH